MDKGFAAKVFQYRSYTPIPFLVLMCVYAMPNLYSLAIGFVLVAAGELIRLWGVSWAGSETRTTDDGVGASYLVISGPFGHVRNPLYVGNILMYVGIGVMSNAAFPYLQIIALVFFLWQYWVIVGEEENYLRGAYGAEYEEFCKNVPRFLPRISAYKNGKLKQPKFSLATGLKSESRTFQATAIVILIIVALWFYRRLS